MKSLCNGVRESANHSLRRTREGHLAQTCQLQGRQAQIRSRNFPRSAGRVAEVATCTQVFQFLGNGFFFFFHSIISVVIWQFDMLALISYFDAGNFFRQIHFTTGETYKSLQNRLIKHSATFFGCYQVMCKTGSLTSSLSLDGGDQGWGGRGGQGWSGHHGGWSSEKGCRPEWPGRHHLAGKAHIARSHVFPTLAHPWKAINHSGHTICSFLENSFLSWLVHFFFVFLSF